MSSSRFLASALELSSLGYHCFPVAERGKRPLTGRGGLHHATRDEDQLRRWWAKWPAANVAVSCAPSGIAVLDIDAKAGRDPSEALAALELEQSELVLAWTGEAGPPSREHPCSLEHCRGSHAWFKGPARTGRVEELGCEIRGRGAYVLAPCSVHESGVEYQWHRRERPPPAAELPELPARLTPRRRVVPTTLAVEPLEAGGRHEGLLGLALALVRRGVVEPDLLRGALREANRVRCRPPLPGTEVAELAGWAAGCDEAERRRHAGAGSWWARAPEEDDDGR